MVRNARKGSLHVTIAGVAAGQSGERIIKAVLDEANWCWTGLRDSAGRLGGEGRGARESPAISARESVHERIRDRLSETG
jgi:hypothetical protein